MATNLHVLILAAGLGTRMKSDLPKVLHRVAGRPLVFWPVALARGLEAKRTLVVLGHKLDDVRAAIDERFPGVEVVRQERQLGTGHAVKEALPALAGEPDDARVLILYGDVPLLSRETVDRLLAAQGDAPMALVSSRLEDPTGYGRVIRDAASRIERIVEHKDALPEERLINEINAGIYVLSLGFLRAGVEALSPQNAQGELYLTDLIARAATSGAVIPSVDAPWEEVAGVNDRVDLARMDAVARRRVNERWMRAGVTMTAPETVAIDADVEAIGRDVELGTGVALRGATRLGDRVRIDVGCILTDTVVGDDALLKPYCVLTQSSVGARAQLGPFAHCRPGTVLDEEVHLGNFVETKKARLGRGSKANHLAYLGDAVIGAKVNVGAGTITCNYDGTTKSLTTIEDGVFIGSDTQLIAPVTVGKGAYVGAGTTVTEDVPAGALAISRTPQVNKEGYVERKRAKR